MPYAGNDGVRIYYEIEGDGPPLVLHAGFGASLDLWRGAGYVEALRGERTLILLDPRGHGRSDKPHGHAAHSYEHRVADVLAVLDDAGIGATAFWGYSMGGRVGYAAARHAPGRFRAFIVGGMHPEAPDPAAQDAEVGALRGGMPDYVAMLEQDGHRLPASFRTLLLANDPDALIASTIATACAPSFTEALANLAVPMLVYVGDRDTPFHDRARHATAGLPRVTFVSLPGLDHGAAFGRSDLILPHVRALLAGVC